MALTIFLIMIVLLLLGFPMMIPLLVANFVGFVFMFGDLQPVNRPIAGPNHGPKA